MKFALKFERCTSACYPYDVALTYTSLVPIFQTVKIILYLSKIVLRFYCKINDSVIGKKKDP